MPKPICFMVMPYDKRKTGTKGTKLPREIDFNALWNKAFEPALKKKYQPVRADQDLGALIIKEMIERLVIADLVVADVTLPNANVYYEVGIRHAAKKNRCVLLAAEGSKQLFDIAQMPHIPYPLKEGKITAKTARQVRTVLEKQLEKSVSGESPVFQSLPGYPDKVDAKKATSFKEFARDMLEFQAKTRAVRIAPSKIKAKKALALIEEYRALANTKPGIALELLYLARDCAGWEDTIVFIESLPDEVRYISTFQEQYWLAKSKTGDHLEAIAALETLSKEHGETAERQGLIGGRYKKMYNETKDPDEKREYLNKAIFHYHRGMEVDMNDYYPSCNLPRLYRTRGEKGDEEKARVAGVVTFIACNRARELDPNDEWVKPTLLGAAFDAGDVAEAQRLAEEIEKEGATNWKLDITLDDLERGLKLHNDEKTKKALKRILNKLKGLLK